MKMYRELTLRRAFHTVSFHDGVKTYRDGSPFFDLKIFRNQRNAARFVAGLKRDGYVPAPWGVAA